MALRLVEGYRLAYHNTVVSHRCFMDDVKVFAKDAQQLGDTMQIVDKVSEVIGMKLGLRKCAVACIEWGKLVEGKDYMLDEERLRTCSNGRYLQVPRNCTGVPA